MSDRGSYRGLMGQPAWGLYRIAEVRDPNWLGPLCDKITMELVGTVRAAEDVEALGLFDEAGMVEPWDQIVNLDADLETPSLEPSQNATPQEGT